MLECRIQSIRMLCASACFVGCCFTACFASASTWNFFCSGAAAAAPRAIGPLAQAQPVREVRVARHHGPSESPASLLRPIGSPISQGRPHPHGASRTRAPRSDISRLPTVVVRGPTPHLTAAVVGPTYYLGGTHVLLSWDPRTLFRGTHRGSLYFFNLTSCSELPAAALAAIRARNVPGDTVRCRPRTAARPRSLVLIARGSS